MSSKETSLQINSHLLGLRWLLCTVQCILEAGSLGVVGGGVVARKGGSASATVSLLFAFELITGASHTTEEAATTGSGSGWGGR